MSAFLQHILNTI